MIAPAFLAFELLFSLVFIACLVHAIHRSPSMMMELVFALLFGVLLEWMTIQQLQAYQYGQFLLMIDGAPLCIGMGWAVIIYSGMQLLESWEMPAFARPFAVGFYALHLDLAMDAIAIRQGFWHWVIPLDSQWHGVPWGNFWAWLSGVQKSMAALVVSSRCADRQCHHIGRDQCLFCQCARFQRI
jgi:hypothetical protein